TQYVNVKEFICLRENPTSSLIVKDITENLIRKMHNHFTLGQIGRLQKDLVTDYIKKIVDTLDEKHCWNNELLCLHMEMVTGNSCEDKILILIDSFRVAIISTFKSWGNEIDCISPHLLVTSKSETFSWIKMSKIESRMYFPEMALHLIIMLFLIGGNSTGLYEHAMQVLLTIFRDEHIKKNLPPKFKGKLLQIFQKNYPNMYTFFMHFSLLIRDIYNPLVTIDLAAHSEIDDRHEDFIVLRQESIESKELLLQNIFQDKGDMFVSNGREGDTKSKELL
ncbi:hypothetical protein KI387_014154, partial [Taxus chinensis]